MKHLEDCPVEPYIPIYLLVGGCFGLLKVLSMLWMQVRYRRFRTVDDSVDDDDDDDDDAETNSGHSPTDCWRLQARMWRLQVGNRRL